MREIEGEGQERMAIELLTHNYFTHTELTQINATLARFALSVAKCR